MEPNLVRRLAELDGRWSKDNQYHVRSVALLELWAGNPQRVLEITEPILRQALSTRDRSNLQLLRTLALLRLDRKSEAIHSMRESEKLVDDTNDQSNNLLAKIPSNYNVLRTAVIHRYLLEEAKRKIAN